MNQQVDNADYQPDRQQTIYLGLGSNLGNRRSNLVAALQMLQAQVVIEQLSTVYETEPAYVAEQPRFLNMACRGQTALPPHALLHFLKFVEQQLGRQPTLRYGPRLIDVDILFYGEAIIDTPDLTIPHPRFAERPFVLVPLAEIAPDLVPPGFTQTVAQLAEQIDAQRAIVANHGSVVE